MAAKDDKRNDPSTTSAAYEQMSPTWQKINTLLAGTEAMRMAGTAYLPQHEEEGNTAYAERRNRATLLNMVKMTLESWVGKPFCDPIEVGEDVPDVMKAFLKDVDLQGNSLDVFARNWFRDGVAKGLSHVLVEFPRPKPRLDGKPRTLEDDRKDNLRPYLVHIRPENCIFGYAKVEGGVERLQHVRILEEHVSMDGFTEACEHKIRVIEPGIVRIYHQVKDLRNPKKYVWRVEEEFTYDLPFIPLVTFYADRQEFMVSGVPLNDLADLNIAHYQSASDQRAVLTVARFPILAVSGAMTDDKLTVGPNQWLSCPDPAGRFYYVEHSGRAINAGRQDLLDLEEVMAEYGATFLKKRPGGASATARALDSAETTSPLQDMAIRFNAALEQAMTFMANWINLDEAGSYTINTEFGMSDGDQVKLDALKEARKGKDVSRSVYLTALQRFGVLGDDFDATQNDADLSSEKDYVNESAIKLAKAKPVPKPAAPGATGKPAKKKPKPAAK